MRACRHRGSVLVEGAMVTLLGLFLLFGIMEVGRLLMGYNLLTHAVREGARLAGILPSLTSNDATVASRINTVLSAGGLTTSQPPTVSFVPPAAGTGLRGTLITVRARVNFVPVTAIVFGSLATIPLQSAVVAQHE